LARQPLVAPGITQKLFPFIPVPTLFPPVRFYYFSLSLFTLTNHFFFHALISIFISDMAKNILFRMRSSLIHVTCPVHSCLL